MKALQRWSKAVTLNLKLSPCMSFNLGSSLPRGGGPGGFMSKASPLVKTTCSRNHLWSPARAAATVQWARGTLSGALPPSAFEDRGGEGRKKDHLWGCFEDDSKSSP